MKLRDWLMSIAIGSTPAPRTAKELARVASTLWGSPGATIEMKTAAGQAEAHVKSYDPASTPDHLYPMSER